MKNFIELTLHTGEKLYIRPGDVAAVHPQIRTPEKTVVYVGAQPFVVNETAEQIAVQIEDAFYAMVAESSGR